ncbi:MAG TPA: alpha/beta hydrolase [Usitatibacter sp.]|nr:alpha/beta hydrolase [Usitatibacter sp.]
MQFIVQGYPAYAYTGARAFEPGHPAVVFIHGAAFDHSVWQWQSRYFAHHGYTVLAVDLPAHGRSPGRARPTIEAMADWVAAFIESAALERVALVGHSMGSLVALQCALSHPRAVAKLALVGASLPMPVGEAFLAAAHDDAPAGLDMEAIWGHSRHAMLATSAVPGMNLVGASRQLNGRSRAGVLHTDLAACQAWEVPEEKLAALDLPILVVGGQRDQMTPFKATQAAAAMLPGARFAALDAGHAMMTEAPRALLRALREFL